MSNKALQALCALLALIAAIEYTFMALWLAFYSHVQAPYYEQHHNEVPIVFDKPAYTTVIEEATGRSWREYANGTIEIITEGNNG